MPRQYHKNPRQITKKQDADLESSLLRLGDISGIVHNLETDEVIGGNQRGRLFDFFGGNCETVLTEQYDTPDEQGTVALGYAIWQGKKYSYRQVRWDEKTAEEANIRANKAGGTWDFDILADNFELDDLLEWGFEPFELGLDDTEAEEPAEDPGAQIDRAEELREKWGVVSGQLWRLGDHRLICGDCTDPAVVARVMGGEKAILCLTDPPYGIERDKGFGGAVGFDGKGKPIPRRQYSDAWDSERPSAETFDGILGQSKQAIFFGGNFFADILPMSTHWIVWDKNNTMPTFGDCELAWTNFDRHSVKKYEITYNGLIGKEAERFHPTQKPVALFSAILGDYSEGVEVVFDPFLGSGTTLIACEQLGRKCRAVELSAAYCAVAIQRWVDMTGQTPELLTD
jgi:DNA modification methylase